MEPFLNNFYNNLSPGQIGGKTHYKKTHGPIKQLDFEYCNFVGLNCDILGNYQHCRKSQ